MDRWRIPLPVLFLLSCCSGASSAGSSDLSMVAASDVGRSCQSLGGPPPSCPQLIVPVSECASQICLVEPTRATCTATCSADDNCKSADVSNCAAGFTCSTITNSGPFAGKKFCACRTDVA